MKNKIAIFATLAIALFLTSCDGPNLNWLSSPNITQQTGTDEVVFVGIVNGTFLDHNMIPVSMIRGGVPYGYPQPISKPTYQPIWARCSDANYKMAVAIGQAVDSGSTVLVEMVQSWYWFRYRFEIVRYSVVPTDSSVVPVPTIVPISPPTKRGPVGARNRPCRNGGSTERYVITNPCPQPMQRPCDCQSISINGNSGQITIGPGGTTVGTITTLDHQAPAPSIDRIEQPTNYVPEKVLPCSTEPEMIPYFGDDVPKKKKWKSEPITFPWN